MFKIVFDRARDTHLNILCLGAHSDDIEIGCGGTILRLIEEYPQINIKWVVFSAIGERANEAQNSAVEFLIDSHGSEIVLKQFKDGYFPGNILDIKNVFEELKSAMSPDIIFTHYQYDLHQDHRQLCELTWNTWRNHFILEYEVPKYDGDLGNPNLFVSLRREDCERKIGLLMEHFQTQANKHWFTSDTFTAMLRLRGVQCKSPDGYAEAFYCRKLLY